MTHADAFLRDILAHPDDDTPRLIYADWLDEQGQSERAEFIRAQIQIAQLSPGSRRSVALRRRVRELLAMHRETWLKDLPKWARRRCEFHRGFVTHVHCTALQFIKHGDLLMNAAPVRSVRVRRGEGRIGALAESPHLAGLTALDLRSNLVGNAGAEALAASPHMRHLATLRLGGNNIAAAGTRALAISPYLSNLTYLDLRNNGVLAELTDAPWLARLTALDLGGTARGVEAFRAFLASPFLPRPKVLSLNGNSLQDAGVELLAASPLLERILTLNLSGNFIRQRGMQALAASPYLAGVRKLSLSWNPFGDAGSRTLLASPHLRQLRRLNVRHCDIDSAKDMLRQRFGSGVQV